MDLERSGNSRARDFIHRRRRPWLVSFVAAALALVVIVPSAFAQIAFRERIHDEYTFSHDECGWTVDVTGEFNGDFFVRVGKGDFAGAFYGHNNFDWTETHVRATDGATITISANALFQETKATHVEGTIYTFTSVSAGQLLVVRDADGRLLLKDRGRITETILFDTLGDDTPGGEFIDLLDVSFAGKFPSETADYCGAFDQ